MSEEKNEEKKVNKALLLKIAGGDLKRAEHCRSQYHVRLRDKVNIEDALKPEFWANVGRILRPFDTIELVNYEATKYYELLVIDAGSLWAKVVIKSEIDLEEERGEAEKAREEALENAPYYIKYNGGDRFCIFRRSDNAKVKKGIDNRLDAEKALDEYIKVINK